MFRSALLASASLVIALPALAQTVPALPPIELDEISVSANLTPTPAREVGSAVTIITREELERKQVRLVSDALRAVPGVAVGRAGGFGGQTQVRIRGSEGNHTLVLIDGMEVNNPATDGEFYFNNLLVQDIERIEVLRGPQSALYGADAVGGVVNIVTRRGEGKPRINTFVEAGSRGTVSGGASLGGSTERADYFFSAGGIRTDGFSTAAEWNGNSEKDGYENLTGFAKLGFQATDILRLDFVGRVTDYYTEGDLDAADVGTIDGFNDLDGRESFARLHASLDLLDGRWQHRLGIGHNNNSYDNIADYGGGASTTSFEGDRTKIDYRTSYLLETDDASHTFTFLADHEWDEAYVSFSEFGSTSFEQTGIAGQYEGGFWNRLFFTAGVRQDFSDKFDDEATWRLTSAYIFDRTETKIRGSLGTAIKNPTLMELYGTSQFFTANPDLRPEKAHGWDVGVDQPLLDGRLTLSATYFEQRIEDLIYLDLGANTVYNLPGASKIDGVELALSAKPTDSLTIRASYTFMDPRDADGDLLVRRPEHAAGLDVDYALLDGRAGVGFGVEYNGGRADTGITYLPEDPWTASFPVTLDEYVLVDIRARYRLNDQAELYGRVENLLDEEYEEVYGFGGTGRLGIVGVRGTF